MLHTAGFVPAALALLPVAEERTKQALLRALYRLCLVVDGEDDGEDGKKRSRELYAALGPSWAARTLLPFFTNPVMEVSFNAIDLAAHLAGRSMKVGANSPGSSFYMVDVAPPQLLLSIYRYGTYLQTYLAINNRSPHIRL